MKCSKLIGILCLFVATIGHSQTWESLTLDENVAGLHENPVRGLIPGFPGIRNFPYSMEFFYLPLRNTMLGIDSLDWTEFETKLEAIADEGNTAVVRFFMDYPGSAVATPQFLIDGGITMNGYTDYGNDPGESLSPDYNDPLTMSALLNFISNFGAVYNGDPRISIVQGGLVGFWGEWHTYPLNNLNMSEANKALIFQAFIDAFPDTKINIRQPQDGVSTNTEMMVGYHDDSFMQSTLGPETWHFWPRIISSGVSDVWKNHPIGGEIYPGLQSTVWDAIPNPLGQDFQVCVDSTHATYMLNHGVFDDSVGSITHLNALGQNKKFGYKFHVSAVKLNAFTDGNIDLDVRIENNGVAPFYYNWDVEFALFQNGTITNLGTTSWNIQTIQPATFIENNFISTQQLDTGTYTILMRFANPLESLKPNAKQLRFTNAEQDAHASGWISLITAEYSTLGVNFMTNAATLNIYPTSVEDEVTIECNFPIDKITIYDHQGRVVRVCSTQGDQKSIQLEVGELVKGQYFVEVNTMKQQLTKRIMKLQ